LYLNLEFPNIETTEFIQQTSASLAFFRPNMESFNRFICPVETCNRAFKSNRGWTVHLRTDHADLNLNIDPKIVIVDVPAVSLLPIQGNHELRSSSPVV
jgi:hypothetical protein